jgi:hypothetical protein
MRTMRIADAEASFRGHLTNLGLRLDGEDVRTVFAAMADWYEQERAEDAASIEEDGDMLLFQWGTYDAGSGRVFEYGLTRQLIGSEDVEDQGIFQLSVSYRYPINVQADALGSGTRWCGRPSGLVGFRQAIDAGPASALTRSIEPLETLLTWQVAG